MTKGRRLTAAELDLWRRATADVDRRLSDTQAPPSLPKPAPAGKGPDGSPRGEPYRRDAVEKKMTWSTPSMAPVTTPSQPLNVDRRTFERLKRGRIAVERRLDLHGRSQAEAHAALDRFITRSAANGLRCLLIVTGKGSDGQGVLRQMVPRWLNEPENREKIITFCAAQPRDGGAGALYVLLKRRRA